ncbi:hypothetical protein Tco_0139414 [Tanacetum coccineum]
MADTLTMAELLLVPTEGDAEAIVVPPIPAEHFELKHSLLNLVTSKQFFGFEKEDPRSNIRWFNKITSTMKYKDVPETMIKLMLFPFSIDSPARIWLEKEPPRSIETWDDLVSKFINNINLMPLSIWRKLSLLELNPTQMILELADRSTSIPTVGDEALTFKVGNTSKFSYNDAESINRIDVIDIACEEYSQEVLEFSGNSESGNPTLNSEPIIAKSPPSLTPFEGGDFILEEIEANLASDSVPPGIDYEDIGEFFSKFPIPIENCDFFFAKTERFTSVPEFETFRFDPEEKNADVSLPEYECFYSEGDIRLLKKFLNEDPSSPLPPKEIKTEELKSVKSSVDEPPELELKDLPSHLEYAFLEGTDKLPVIIAKDLKDDENERLIKDLKSHKHAIAWKLSDIKGICWDLIFKKNC